MSGRGGGGVDGAGGLCRWCEGDGVAECFELVDVLAFAAVGLYPVVEEFGAEVPVAGGGVGQELPDDDEDGAGGRDEGFEFADSSRESPVAGPEEGAGAPGGGGRFTEDTFEVPVAFAGGSRAGSWPRTARRAVTVSPRTPDGLR